MPQGAQLVLDLTRISLADVTLVLVGAGVIVTAVRRGWPVVRSVVHLVEDLVGEEPRHGLPDGRPGVMNRLDALDEQIAAVKAEVTTNGGTSLKDSVKRIEERLALLADPDVQSQTPPEETP